jgi:hypothetical protein
MQVSDIVTLIVSITALGGVVITWLKLKPEGVVMDADAASKYGELVDRAAKRENEYQNRIDVLQARILSVEAKFGELQIEVRAANYRAERFEGWAKRLAFQVQSLGGVPVPIDPSEAETVPRPAVKKAAE